MTDPFDDFARTMRSRTKAQIVQEAAERLAHGRSFSEAEKAERALISAMANYPLKSGQMLLLGPKSVALLSTPGAYNGVLPDRHILDRREWSVV